MDILCVGQMVADVLIQGVDKLGFEVDTQKVSRIVIQNGGDCMNTAIDLKILGNSVGFAGVLGRDIMGEFLLKKLEQNGIDSSGISFLDYCDTSMVAAVINSTGERVFLYYGGSNDEFCIGHVNLNQLRGCKIVHVGGTYMLPKFDGEGACRLFEEAHKCNAFTSMDVTYDTSGKWMEIIEPCLKHLDLFMPSMNEAKNITGTEKPEEISCVLKEKGVKHVIVKMGERGCYVNAFGKEFYQPPFPVNVVDTTGAGDSFVAGILTGINNGWQIEKTVYFASAVSANCIGKLGATAGVISLEETEKFMNKYAMCV